MKTCSKCGTGKSESEFYKNNGAKDGLEYHCKACEAERKRQARAKNPEVFRERFKQYKANNLEKVRAKNKRYKNENREKVNESRRRRRAETIQHLREVGRALYEKSKEKRREQARLFGQKNREQIEEKRRIRRKVDPVKTYARNAVEKAVREGIMPRVNTLKCQNCENQAEHYHHESYDKSRWFDVIPLCAKCHKRVHAGIVSLKEGG